MELSTCNYGVAYGVMGCHWCYEFVKDVRSCKGCNKLSRLQEVVNGITSCQGCKGLSVRYQAVIRVV